MDSDSEIRQAVINALNWDPAVPRMEITVHVRQGIVTLLGTVNSCEERRAAVAAAHRVAGVRDVVNGIVAHVSMAAVHRDEQLARAARLALESDPLVPHERIGLTVCDCWISLTGDVDLPIQRSAAENAIRRLPAVTGVANEIVLTGSQPRATDPTAASATDTETYGRQGEGGAREGDLLR